jgi:hypothetical protein
VQISSAPRHAARIAFILPSQQQRYLGHRGLQLALNAADARFRLLVVWILRENALVGSQRFADFSAINCKPCVAQIEARVAGIL